MDLGPPGVRSSDTENVFLKKWSLKHNMVYYTRAFTNVYTVMYVCNYVRYNTRRRHDTYNLRCPDDGGEDKSLSRRSGLGRYNIIAATVIVITPLSSSVCQ